MAFRSLQRYKTTDGMFLIDAGKDTEHSIIIITTEEQLTILLQQVNARNDASAKLLLNSVRCILRTTKTEEAFVQGTTAWESLLNQLLLFYVCRFRVQKKPIPIIDPTSISLNERMRIEIVKTGGRLAGSEFRT